MSFEELYAAFLNKDLTFAQIAEGSGASDRTISRLYETYFRDLVGGESGPERRKKQRERSREATIRSSTIPDVRELQLIAELARGQGFCVRPYITVFDGHVNEPSLRRLWVANKLCFVHPIRSFVGRPGRGQRYAVAKLARKTVDGAEVHIFPVLINNLNIGPFVIPSSILLEKRFPEGVDVTNINFPLKQHLKLRRKPFDVWDYHQAWKFFLA